MKRALVGLLVLLVAAGVGYAAFGVREKATADSPQGTGEVRWIVAGGGATPESNEVSIEEDLRLARRVLGGDGVTLFASGRDNQAVRVEATDLGGDPLVTELGAMFSPRPGRTSSYRPASIDADGAASPTRFLETVRTEASSAGKPLTIYVAGHGDKGETPAQNAVVMWANFTVTPVDLAEALASTKRQTRLVFTTCFSGGFAEVAFAAADESKGAVPDDVCGLFASTWDLEAGGCDPDPDRGLHDGYGVHFLNALDGKTRTNETVAADIAGDGRVSLLDAHTYARMKSGSIDVPTTTSERWLRSTVEPATRAEPYEMPHEAAVITALGPKFDNPDEDAARERLQKLDAEIAALADAEAAAIALETEAYWDVAAAMLARWPVIDDPWHPLWQGTIDTHRAEITAFLQTSPLMAAFGARTEEVNAISTERIALEVRRAPLMRLVRAHETRRLAGALAARGGPDWERFQKFRACEDSR